MVQNINLKELEKNTWTSFYQNGLIDIQMGLIFVVGSICMIFSDIRYYLMSLYVIPILLFILAKKYIVLPRMGIVKFSRKRKRKSTILTAVITTTLVFLVSLTLIAKTNTNIIPPGIAPQVVISAIILIICLSIAFFLNFNRMYVYAFLITGSLILSEIIRANPGIISRAGHAYLLTAAVMICTGGIYLVRFLKKYPLPVEGAPDDN